MATTDETVTDETVDAVIETLDPKYISREWKVTDHYGGEVLERTYVQRPLSFMGKLEFFSLLGRTLQSALQEEGADALAGLVVTAQSATAPSGGINGMDDAVALMTRLAQYVPEFVLDSCVIALRVPKGEREWVKSVWETDLSDDDGMEMVEIFIEQNAEALRDFFVQRVPKLGQRISQKMNLAGLSPSSTPSKPTRRTTRSR